MQYFEYEIKINVFRYVQYTLNLVLTCRSWSVIVKDLFAKAEWLIVHNLLITIFTYLLNEGYSQLSNSNEDISSKRNIFSGPYVVVLGKLRKNLKEIEDLILNKRFISFPTRPKALRLYLNSDGYIHQPS